MAWKKDYLKNNKHDDDKSHAEESSFTKGFTEKMVQLDPLKFSKFRAATAQL
jgi:hypothetical protein